MFEFLKKDKKNTLNNEIYIKTAALLIHAAKIDQNYELEEKNIIKRTIINLGASKEDSDNLIDKAEKYESNSNQILNFTREIKKMDEKFKINIVETLWQIIYSDGLADVYEANLMRRLTGLMYIDNKTVAEIKNKVKSS